MSFREYNSTKQWLRDGFERIAVTKNVVSDAYLSHCAEFVVHLLDKTIARYSFRLSTLMK